MKLRNKKTGEAVYVDFQIPLCNHDETLGSYSVTSLEALNRSFEDYEPKEPLIKDEKICKAVRAWADVVGEETFIVSHNMEHHDCCIYTGCLSDTATIDFGLDLNLKDGSYTIDELCGEKEE